MERQPAGLLAELLKLKPLTAAEVRPAPCEAVFSRVRPVCCQPCINHVEVRLNFNQLRYSHVAKLRATLGISISPDQQAAVFSDSITLKSLEDVANLYSGC